MYQQSNYKEMDRSFSQCDVAYQFFVHVIVFLILIADTFARVKNQHRFTAQNVHFQKILVHTVK